MANHKRKKSRSKSGCIRVSRETIARRKHHQRSNNYSLGRPPAWYILTFLNRPFRRKMKAACHQAMVLIDPEDIEIPVSRSAANYFC